MEEKKVRYQTFEDLEAYRLAREFRKAMYRIVRKLPATEKFGLASQVRRAAVSLTNSIAEGHGRFHYIDQIKFMLQARRSLEELLDDLNVCEDENYLPLGDISALKEPGWHVHRLSNGYVRFLRRRKTENSSRVEETTLHHCFGEEYLNEPSLIRPL